MNGDIETSDGAVLDSHGTFTIAAEKAREKMRQFQLPDPHYYILQLVQAVVASGATTIEIEHRTWTLTGDSRSALNLETGFNYYALNIRFDGPGYTDLELSNLYGYILESQRMRERDRLR